MAEKTGAEVERRILSVADLNVEARLDQGEKAPKLVGYAALFNRTTELMPGFFERVAPGAFSRSLAEGADVRALVDHDSSKILGRRKAGTLDLEENRKGLKSTIYPPETGVGRDIVTSVTRGDVDQMSFAFMVRKESWEDKTDGTSIRTLEDVDLFDVSVVTYPAYDDTSVAVRKLEQRRREVGEATPGASFHKDPETQKRRRELRKYLDRADAKG